jgi:PKD repeat protein
MTHSKIITGLTNGSNYKYYVKCQDLAGNTSTDDDISFNIPSSIQSTAAPVAQFSATPLSGSSPLPVQFTNLSTGAEPMTYEWDYNNTGYIGSTEKNPSGTYDKVGPHSVKLTVTNAYGSDSEVKLNYINLTSSTTTDTTAPVISNSQPSGVLSLGTTQTTISLTTNESATCRYSIIAGTAYASMTAFTTTGGTTHSRIITGLTNGSNYKYYVKCQDSAGNTNIGDPIISFSIASPQIPVAQFSATPLSGNSPLKVQFNNLSTGTEPMTYQWFSSG